MLVPSTGGRTRVGDRGWLGGRSGSGGFGGFTGAVEVAVADAERGVDEAADVGLLHPPDAQPHRGHPVAAAQHHRRRRRALARHARWIRLLLLYWDSAATRWSLEEDAGGRCRCDVAHSRSQS